MLLENSEQSTKISLNHTMQPNWSNATKNDRYLQAVTNKISKLGKLTIPTDVPFNLKTTVNKRFEDINNIFKEAASESGCIPHKTLKPKAYWCPNLSALRDKKRYWWEIWVSCDRPRNGIIYDIHKDLKKKFRRLCRKNISALSKKPLDTLNRHFKNNDMCAFWNKLKSNNHTKTNSKLRSNEFADFYSSTMSDNNNLTEEQLEICKTVKDKATALTCICKTTRDSKLDNMAEDTIKTEICSNCGHTWKQTNLTIPDSCLREQSVKKCH